MKSKDVVIGMKVIPFRKSVGSPMDSSPNWNYGGKQNGFLYVSQYVIYQGKWCWGLSKNPGGGCDYYMAGDFHPHPEHAFMLFPKLITLEYEEKLKELKWAPPWSYLYPLPLSECRKSNWSPIRTLQGGRVGKG